MTAGSYWSYLGIAVTAVLVCLIWPLTTALSPSDAWQVRDSMQRPRPDGRGIGLSSVSLILRRLGGALQIVGREDVGTVVEITLPLRHPACERIH